jgi:hypothetical protein
VQIGDEISDKPSPPEALSMTAKVSLWFAPASLGAVMSANRY